LAAVAAALGALLPATSLAAFPGANGKLAFSSPRSGFPTDSDIFTMGSDGSAQTAITALNGDELYPAWSPDGSQIAFQRDPGLSPEIWTSKADGTSLRQLTSSTSDRHPSWSPDGAKIAFASDRAAGSTLSDLFVMNADGSAQVNITNTPTVDEDYPVWSPDGAKIAFSRDGDIATLTPGGTGLALLTATERIENEPDWSPDGTKLAFHVGVNADDEIFKMNADGSGVTNLTNSGPTVEEGPVWSPAGDRIVFTKGAFSAAEIWTMNPDGSDQTQVTINSFLDAQPSWQPTAPGGLTGYPRPRGATPLRFSLVPAYVRCSVANRTHAAPLAYPSCNPPVPWSHQATVGTPDANGQPAKLLGSVRASVIGGDPATSADEADLGLVASIVDVRDKADLSDYTGELQVTAMVRITDRGSSGPSWTNAATVTDFPFSFTVSCASTSDTTIGSTCATATTADALVPNTIKEINRTIWEVRQLQVNDGGEDRVVSTAADNTLFLKQGVFVP